MKMKMFGAALLLSVSTISLAQAQEAAPAAGASTFGTFSSTVGIYSDYRFRGITQTSESPALQGSIDWEHDSGIYAGVWGSNVDFKDGDEANVELDAYLGFKTSFAGLDFDFGALGYFYPGADDNLNYDYYEAKIAVSKDFEWAAFGAGLNYSPENFGDSGDATYVALNASAPIMDTGLTIDGTYGYQWIDDEVAFGVPDYSDWSVGLGYSWNTLDFAVRYTDTDLSSTECGDNCDATAVFSVSRSF